MLRLAAFAADGVPVSASCRFCPARFRDAFLSEPSRAGRRYKFVLVSNRLIDPN